MYLKDNMTEYKIWVLNSEDIWQISLIFLVLFFLVFRIILVVLQVPLQRLRSNGPMTLSRKRARNWAQ